MNLDPVILHKLVNRRLFTAKDLLVATHLELVEALDNSYENVENLILFVSNAIAPRVSTVSIQQLIKVDSVQHSCFELLQTC